MPCSELSFLQAIEVILYIILYVIYYILCCDLLRDPLLFKR